MQGAAQVGGGMEQRANTALQRRNDGRLQEVWRGDGHLQRGRHRAFQLRALHNKAARLRIKACTPPTLLVIPGPCARLAPALLP